MRIKTSSTTSRFVGKSCWHSNARHIAFATLPIPPPHSSAVSIRHSTLVSFVRGIVTFGRVLQAPFDGCTGRNTAASEPWHLPRKKNPLFWRTPLKSGFANLTALECRSMNLFLGSATRRQRCPTPLCLTNPNANGPGSLLAVQWQRSQRIAPRQLGAGWSHQQRGASSKLR